MLFNSLSFIFLFLPVALAGYYATLWIGLRRYIFVYVVIASLVFYSVWNPAYTILLIASIAVNYLFGVGIERARSPLAAKLLLTAGVVVNLAALGYYKYANFFIQSANMVLGSNWTFIHIILPLGISFFTFQQIAYLVDISRGTIRSGGIARYATFVLFFPQLIAGPIVHYKEMMPQFFDKNVGRFPVANIAIGTTIFAIGLFKKTVIADCASLYAAPIYGAAYAGHPVGFADGWTAAITYTIQLYFDFSGYSDMAIGLARMFGIRLPLNFHSPLRAASIIEYWRRWHMTLQQFIVSYMYQPILLPVTRFAARRSLGKWASFFVTVALPMVGLFALIGLWHGPSWTFVIFGVMHGVYLAINEYWRKRFQKRRKKQGQPRGGVVVAYHVVTLLAVAFANVMFRAQSVASAVEIWKGMLRVDQIAQLAGTVPLHGYELFTKPFALCLAAIVILAFFPNTQQFMGRYNPALHWSKWREVAPPRIVLTWRPTLLWAAAVGVLLFFGISFTSRGQSVFIYFNF